MSIFDTMLDIIFDLIPNDSKNFVQNNILFGDKN